MTCSGRLWHSWERPSSLADPPPPPARARGAAPCPARAVLVDGAGAAAAAPRLPAYHKHNGTGARMRGVNNQAPRPWLAAPARRAGRGADPRVPVGVDPAQPSPMRRRRCPVPRHACCVVCACVCPCATRRRGRCLGVVSGLRPLLRPCPGTESGGAPLQVHRRVQTAFRIAPCRVCCAQPVHPAKQPSSSNCCSVKPPHERDESGR